MTSAEKVADQVEIITFTIPGTPVPQGSKSARVVKGRAFMFDQNRNLKPWRAEVKRCAEKAMYGRDRFDAALSVNLRFYMPRPSTVKRPRPSVRPDIDKLIRAVFDALTDAQVWKDDSLVVHVSATEWYADDEPYAEVTVQLA